MTWTEAVVLVVMLVGLVGVFIPVIPGLPSILGAGIVWAFAGDVGPSGWAAVAAMALFAALGSAAPYWLAGRRGVGAGLPGWVLLAAAVGTVVGFFAIPVVGALVGGPAGIFVAELVRHRDVSAAWRSTATVLKALGLGVLVQFVAGVAIDRRVGRGRFRDVTEGTPILFRPGLSVRPAG